MIDFKEFTLENGLQVIVHEDPTVRIATLNVLYDVGSRDEDPQKTGFAHLFEHLMFGGSQHIPDYDAPLERVGGENNAFTTSDITNYYLTLSAENIETGFWLESDRMLALSFDPEVLEVQRKVVIEEVKQRYFNQPYGDVWLKLRPLAYTRHPYLWATIGKEIAHIEQATLDDVRSFFYKYYIPSNAVLVVAGNVSEQQVRFLAEKWFGPIPGGKKPERHLPVEPVQRKKRYLEVEAAVPADALYKAYHIPGRFHNDHYAVELMSDILSDGHSSRLYHKLVKEQELFTSIASYSTESIDPALFIISGRLREGVSLKDAEDAVDAITKEFIEKGPTGRELDKVKNQAEADLEFEEVEVLNRAMNLAFAKLSGDAGLVNKEKDKIASISIDDVRQAAGRFVKEENSSVLYYKARDKKKAK